jgi:hypothetical protein
VERQEQRQEPQRGRDDEELLRKRAHGERPPQRGLQQNN